MTQSARVFVIRLWNRLHEYGGVSAFRRKYPESYALAWCVTRDHTSQYRSPFGIWNLRILASRLALAVVEAKRRLTGLLGKELAQLASQGKKIRRYNIKTYQDRDHRQRTCGWMIGAVGDAGAIGPDPHDFYLPEPRTLYSRLKNGLEPRLAIVLYPGAF